MSARRFQHEAPSALSYADHKKGERCLIQTQYSAKSLELLEEKVAQFPRGARFALMETSPETQDQRQLEDRVTELFEKKGMVIERQPPHP